MVEVINSETSGSCDLTVNWSFTPSERTNLALTSTSIPPRKTPKKQIFQKYGYFIHLKGLSASCYTVPKNTLGQAAI